MQLAGLKPLYKSMVNENMNRAKFDFTFRKVQFKCLLLTDKEPFLLMLGVQNKNFYLEFKVKPVFNINPYLGGKYYELCEILGLKPDENNRFSPKAFFEHVNLCIPNEVTQRNRPLPSDIAPYRSNVEESHKIYFQKWLPHNGINSNASPENLQKTRDLIGEDAYRTCKERNISSVWSPDIKYADNMPGDPNERVN